MSKKGYEIVPFPITTEEVVEIKDIYLGLVSNNPFQEFCEVIDHHHEKPLPMYAILLFIFKASTFTRLLLFLLLKLTGNQRLAEAVKKLKILSETKQKELHFRRLEILNSLRDRFKKLDLDAFICPTYVSCAFKNENCSDMGGLFDYTIIWNCFDFPAGIVPVTKVENTDEEYEDGY